MRLQNLIEISKADFSKKGQTYLLKTPPKSDAFKHSGGESLLCTSPTVTLYLDVELSRLSLPGTEQNTSLGELTPEIIMSCLPSELRLSPARIREEI